MNIRFQFGGFTMDLKGMVSRAPVTTASVQQVSSTITQQEGTQMDWLATLLNLIPIIATGVQALHSDKSKADKTAMAQDALTLATAGAAATLPPADAAIASQVGAIASTTLAATVSALHDAATPAPAAA